MKLDFMLFFGTYEILILKSPVEKGLNFQEKFFHSICSVC